MSEVSIIEFIVYGLVGYTGIIMLVASSFREVPAMKSQSTVRSIWLIAPIICMYMLSSAGAQINLDQENILVYNGTGALVTNSTSVNTINFVQPVWITLHFLFFIMLVIYFIWNMLQTFVKRE